MKDEKKDPDFIRLGDLGAMIAVHYPDFLLMVRTKQGGLAWKFTDPTWALGASVRVPDIVVMSTEQATEGDAT